MTRAQEDMTQGKYAQTSAAQSGRDKDLSKYSQPFLAVICLVCSPATGMAQGPGLPPPTNETVLHSFSSAQLAPRGANPIAGVTRDAAGNLYGTTSVGGSRSSAGYLGAGVVYKIDPAGNETVLYSFTGGFDGANPVARVILDSSGNLYGTTLSGGLGGGVVFKVDPTGHETVLHAFNGNDGDYPSSGELAIDTAGNLYGTTAGGGAASAGVAYKLDPTGHETVLYSFSGGVDGSNPFAGVILDSAGNLYGTTSRGGVSNQGVLFKVNPAGQESVLYSFTGGIDGGQPSAGVIFDSGGNLYGTTQYGGTGSAPYGGSGVVYQVDPSGHETVLYNFSGGADGGYPRSDLIRDSAGNLYGTTNYGGSSGGGVVYKVSPSGQETVLFNVLSNTGIFGGSVGSLTFDSFGNLYGTTRSGAANAGSVFKLSSSGEETLLYSFPIVADGASPAAGVIRDSAGNLYGTTAQGGPTGGGTVFKVDLFGNETVLYSFTGGADGAHPYSGVIRDSAGNLYGTTAYGGASGWGVVYKVDPSGHESVLYSFTGGSDGGNPYTGVVRDAAGNLFGTTRSGGWNNWGVVYKLDPSGLETVLYRFPSGDYGGNPGNVIIDSAGNLYGTTSSVVYKLDPAGYFNVLHSFSGGVDGGGPIGGLIRDLAGNLYGATYNGGIANAGVVFKLDPSGHETVIYSFTGGIDGSGPGGLAVDSEGNLYGTASGGGTGLGVVFKLNTANQETVLHSFVPADGGYPSASVVLDSENLYGTTNMYGAAGDGVVFRINLGGQAGTPPQIVVTKTLLRDPNINQIVAKLQITNSGGSTASNVQLTIARIGTSAEALPQSIGDLDPGYSQTATVTFPAYVGSPGATAVLTIGGTYTGGSFNSTTKITLP